MKTAAELKYLSVLCAILACSGGRALAQTDAQRINALEERVAQLERMVDVLTQSRDQAESNSANQLRDSVAELATPPSTSTSSSMMPTSAPQELLPNLGKIGAAAFIDAGINTGPFSLGRGSFLGGGLSLPLALAPGGRLNYEVTVALAQNSRLLPITSSVAQLINLSVLNALYPAGGASKL
jgi:hypothetical protein